MAEKNTNELLQEILNELRNPLYVNYGPPLAGIWNAILLVGLAASDHVEKEVAQEAAQKLKELAEQRGLIARK